MIKIFQIYYANEQKQKLTKGFIPYLNQGKSVYAENQCISDIRHSDLIEDADYIGTFSHSVNKKVSNITFGRLCDSITSKPDGDIFSPSPKNWRAKILRNSNPPYFPNQLNMKDLAIPLLNDMADLNIIKKSSIDLWTKPYPIIFCNFWAAKQEVFIDYVDNFLSNVFELIESYDKDNWIFNACNRYPKPPKAWQDGTGFSRYPIIVFMLERLINIYLQDRNLNHQPIL